MSKVIKQRDLNDDETEKLGEFISLEWAVETAIGYLDLTQQYMKSCMLSPLIEEREKYYESAMETLSKLVIPLEMVGMLADPEALFVKWFGEDIAKHCVVVEKD